MMTTYGCPFIYDNDVEYHKSIKDDWFQYFEIIKDLPGDHIWLSYWING